MQICLHARLCCAYGSLRLAMRLCRIRRRFVICRVNGGGTDTHQL
jgi:hypothetical protein